jgi:hypothetical protein
MTDKQLAILLTDYRLAVREICRLLDEHEIPEAYTQAVELGARLEAYTKSLDAEVYISPLG